MTQSRAIVLHIQRYNDESLIADVLTEERGCVGMMVRVSRSRRAAVRHTLFRPLAVLDLTWDDRPRASLQRPRAAQTALPLCSVPYHPLKSAMALFIAEFLHHAVRTERDCREVFGYVVRSVEWLDACPSGFANFHLVFLMRLTRFLGIEPNAAGAETGAFFDLRSAEFVPSQPLHADFLRPEDARLVPLFMRMRYGNMRVFRFSGAERSRLLAYINTYYRLHLPAFPELRSLAVLREVFGD